jgi:CBS domain-containing protein
MTSVKDILANRPVFALDKDATVQAGAEYMAKNNIGAIPVVDGTRLMGIFSERDIINRVIAKSLSPTGTRIADVMTTNLVVASSDETHEDCLKKMKQAGCRHLPIVEGETLVGIISVRDLLDVEINEKEDKIQFLHDYMFHMPAGVEKKYAGKP